MLSFQRRSAQHLAKLVLRGLSGQQFGSQQLVQQELPASAAASYHNGDGFESGYVRERTRATTILCVRKGGQVVMIGDGQVSMGDTIAKPNAKKVRRIGESVVCGFAGSAADGLTLLERLETKLEEHPGQLLRAAVELAKVWRQDKALRFLQAELLVADSTTTLTVSGNGDVLEPHDGVMAIGSGGRFAVAAARALIDLHDMDAGNIARRSMKIASDMCVYTNSNFTIETLSTAPPEAGSVAEGTDTLSTTSTSDKDMTDPSDSVPDSPPLPPLTPPQNPLQAMSQCPDNHYAVAAAGRGLGSDVSGWQARRVAELQC